MARAVDGEEALTPHGGTTGAEKTENKQTFPISSETKSNIRKDLVHYRMQLQKNIGRSTVDSVALSSGFPIELIDLTIQHLSELNSLEKVKAILPVYKENISTSLFSLIQKHCPRDNT